jgi:hypothetical protein
MPWRERKDEIIALEWATLWSLWASCRHRADANEQSQIDSLFPRDVRGPTKWKMLDSCRSENRGRFPKGGTFARPDAFKDCVRNAFGRGRKSTTIWSSEAEDWLAFNRAELAISSKLDAMQLKQEYDVLLEFARARRIDALADHKRKAELLSGDDKDLARHQAIYRTLLYTLQSGFVTARFHRRLRRQTAVRLTVVGALLLLLASSPYLIRGVNVGIWTVAVFGAFGAYFSRVASFHSKLSTLNFDDVMEEYELRMLLTRLLFGAVGAVVFYCVMRAGFISGSAFPRLTQQPMTDGTPLDAADMAGITAPPTEVAKLWVWSFVAGFSERLAPDAIARSERSVSDRQGA